MKKTIATIAAAAVLFGSVNAFATLPQQDTTKSTKTVKRTVVKKEKKAHKHASKAKKDTTTKM
jgi:hypothetical protein